jgi:multidrug efflux pump subunit AcrB
VLSVWMLRNPIAHHKLQETFFDRLRARYDRFARALMKRRRIAVLSYLIVSGAIILAVGSSLGTAIFPIVDTGQLQLHLRAPAGTRRFGWRW